MGLGESAQAGAIVLFLMIALGLTAVVLVVGLVLRARTGSWRPAAVLWAGYAVVVAVYLVAVQFEPQQVSARRASALRDEVLAGADVTLEDHTLETRSFTCAQESGRAQVASGSADLADGPDAGERLSAAMAEAGLTVDSGTRPQDQGPSLPPLQVRWWLGQDGDRSMLVEAFDDGFVRVQAEDGCVQLAV